MLNKVSSFLLSVFVMLQANAALATGQPEPWGLGFQEAVSPSMERINDFHNMMLWIISAIVVFVFILLVYVVARYNEKVNPTPEKFSHHVLLEVVWTVIPVVILIIIAIPSFKLLYYTDRTAEPEMTLKVTGYQWY